MPFVTREQWRIFWGQEYTVLCTLAETLVRNTNVNAQDIVHNALVSFDQAVGEGREVVQEWKLLYRISDAESAQVQGEDGMARLRAENIEALNNAQLPDQLRDMFVGSRTTMTLSDQITVVVEENGNKWIMTDMTHERRYLIQGEDESIAVYTEATLEETVRKYLCTVVKYRVLDAWRQVSRNRETHDLPHDLTGGVTPEEAALQESLSDELRMFGATLPEARQQFFLFVTRNLDTDREALWPLYRDQYGASRASYDKNKQRLRDALLAAGLVKPTNQLPVPLTLSTPERVLALAFEIVLQSAPISNALKDRYTDRRVVVRVYDTSGHTVWATPQEKQFLPRARALTETLTVSVANFCRHTVMLFDADTGNQLQEAKVDVVEPRFRPSHMTGPDGIQRPGWELWIGQSLVGRAESQKILLESYHRTAKK